ncbi:MAG: cytochrome c-type biogenesis protein [Acidimicrobiia bacterium]
MQMRRVAPWIALLLVVAGALFVATRDDGGPTTVNDRVRSIASELRCVDCQSQSVATSSTASARAFRADIRRRVEAGQSDGEIKRAFVDRYGEFILLKPTGSGLGLIVWGLPVLVLVVGAGGLFLALRRWRREPRLTATAADEQLVAEARRDP